MLYDLLKPAVFNLDPEQAHDLAIAGLEKAGQCRVTRALLRSHYGFENPRLAQTIWNLHFPNPVGMAAGFDKNARAVPALAALGFGFIEIGTVTPKAQPGNPRPRIFRYAPDGALINRMGFPNQGADAVATRLARLGKAQVPLGINLGKNKDTPLEAAAQDYVATLERLFPHGDYAVVNISSPNTPGLRLLQGPAYLEELMREVQSANQRLARQHGRAPLPILLKIAPDLASEDLAAIAALARRDSLPQAPAADKLIDGFIATNTTLSRHGLRHPSQETGGLSGRPLAARSTEIIRLLHRLSAGSVPIIGVGGIASGADAYAKLRAGASLVQIYTGFIFEGPALARRIKQELCHILEKEGITRLGDIIGRDA